MLGLNVNGLTRAGRELEVQLLLDDLRPAVVALSETEVPEEDSVMFNNYKVFYPLATAGKGLYRLLLLIREDYVARYNPTLIRNSTMEVWVKMETPCGLIAISSVYRQWTGSEEEGDLHRIDDAIRNAANEYDRLLIIGDMNLDVARLKDTSYYRRKLLDTHMECLEECGLSLANELDMSPTFTSYGTFENTNGSTSQKSSILDHVYYKGLPPPSFTVLPMAITDHRPTLSRFNLLHRSSGLKSIHCRNFKSINTAVICCAINATALSKVFELEDVEEVHTIIVNEITAALDLVAPLKEVKVKERSTPLYLTAETRSVIRERDCAATLGNHIEYRRLRNLASRLVRKDKLGSNVANLQRQGFDPKAVWHLANTTTGRTARSTLPAELVSDADGSSVKGDANLADHVNNFYIDKIDKIRERIEQQQQQQQQ